MTHNNIHDNELLSPETVENNHVNNAETAKEKHIALQMNGKNPSYINHAEHVHIISTESCNEKSVPTHSTPPIRQLLTRRTVLLTTIFSIIVVVSVSLFYRQCKYQTLMDEANTKFRNREYIDAAELYHKASVYSITSSDFTEAACFEADCYMTTALNGEEISSLNETLLNNFYDRAIEIYNHILTSQRCRDKEFYFDAASGLSNCYLYSGYSFDNENWKKAISIMEKRIDTAEKNNYTGIPLSQLERLYSTLGNYYYKLHRSTNENFKNADIAQKALDYYNEYAKLYITTEQQQGIIDESSYVYLAAISSDNMINCALATKKPSDYFPQVIKLCESTIKAIHDGTLNNVNMTEQFRITYTLGKAYYYLIPILYPYGHEKYRKLAYETLSPLLENDWVKTDNLLTDAGYYCAMTGMCTKSDIAQIIENYKSGLNAMSLEDNPQDYMHHVLQILSTCTLISISTDYDNLVDAYGLKLSDFATAKINFIKPEEKDKAYGYYDYFHDGDRNGIQHEEFLCMHFQENK